MSESKLIGVIVSDVHIGASKVESLLFEYFLDEIISRENLETFIVNGDFFDIVMMDYDKIVRTYSNIFYKMDQIQNKFKNKFLFTLGNHEIAVTGLINRNFSCRRDLFIELFRDSLGKHTKTQFLKEDKFFQYILLFRQYAITLISKGFDKIGDLIEFIKCNKDDDSFQPFCLITHGHQFEGWLKRNIAGFFGWSPFIKIRWNWVKKGMDVFWNYLASGTRKVPDVTDDDIENIIKYFKVPEKDRKKVRKFLKKALKYETKLSQNTNEKYYKKIRKFLKKRKFKIIKERVPYISFGHSHWPEDTKALNWKPTYEFYNSGGWQKIIKPSYIEIRKNSDNELNLEVKYYKFTLDYTEFEVLIRLFNISVGEYFKALMDKGVEYKTLVEYSTDEIIEQAKEKGIIKTGDYEMLRKYSKIPIVQKFNNKKTPTVLGDPSVEDINNFKSLISSRNENINLDFLEKFKKKNSIIEEAIKKNKSQE